MFVEHKEVGEVTEAPSKVLKMSEAIRRGKPLVKEDRSQFCWCALGCAFAGVHGRAMTMDENFRLRVRHGTSNVDTARGLARELGFSEDIGVKVNELHYGERMPALKIADWLESQGY